MQIFAPILTTLLSLLLAASALVDLHRSLLRASHPAAARSAHERGLRLDSARSIAASFLPESSDALILSGAAQDTLKEDRPADPARLQCELRGALQEALIARPLSSELVLALAKPEARCPAAGALASAKDLPRVAMELEPVNVSSIFEAAKLLLQAGEIDQGSRALGRLLELGGDVSPEWRELILSALHEPEDLQRIVPAKLVQAAYWSELLLERDPARYAALASALGEIQARALEEGRGRHASGALPAARYERELTRLAWLPLASDLRRELDVELGKILEARGSKREREFYETRRRLDTLRHAPSQRRSDGRPHKSAFLAWGGPASVRLDYSNGSVGFYLSPDQSVRRIELRGHPGDPEPLLTRLMVLVSDDNSAWRELSDGIRAESYRVGDRPVVVIRSAARAYRYWKIHFSGSDEARSFGNRLDRMVAVYGQARTDI